VPCFTPLKAYRAPGGGVAFNSKEGYVDRPLELQCGQCRGCRLNRSKEWALRCIHEAQLHDANCFITLTYDSDQVPADGGLDVSHWQKFAKRVRKRVGPFRFLHCGEYGEKNFRPHFHACMFGQDFSKDREVWKSDGPNETFVSPMLDELWGKGFATVGHLTWQSAAYVARYVMKKATGPLAEEKYRRIDLETGEEFFVKPEYVTMSRRPGLASGWFEKYRSDVFPEDVVVHSGAKHRPPKYYDRLLESEAPQEFETIRGKRRDWAFKRREESTPERLRVREEVLEARLSRLVRDL